MVPQVHSSGALKAETRHSLSQDGVVLLSVPAGGCPSLKRGPVSHSVHPSSCHHPLGLLSRDVPAQSSANTACPWVPSVGWEQAVQHDPS